jgi:hypothetical protein
LSCFQFNFTLFFIADQAQGLGSGKTKSSSYIFSIPFSGFPEAPVREATPLTTLPKAAQGRDLQKKNSVSDSDPIKTPILDKNPRPGENVTVRNKNFTCSGNLVVLKKKIFK